MKLAYSLNDYFAYCLFTIFTPIANRASPLISLLHILNENVNISHYANYALYLGDFISRVNTAMHTNDINNTKV